MCNIGRRHYGEHSMCFCYSPQHLPFAIISSLASGLIMGSQADTSGKK